MPRAKGGSKSRQRRKKIMKLAKGYVGGRGRLYRSARETVERALAFAYRDRRVKKRTFRGLWITRIGAAAKINGLSYSQLIKGLKASRRGDRPQDFSGDRGCRHAGVRSVSANRKISPKRVSVPFMPVE